MEQDVLQRIKKTDEFSYFLATRKYGWSHEDWLNLLQNLRKELGYEDIDEHQLGVELEKQKFLLNELRNDAHFRTFLKKNPSGWNHKGCIEFLKGAHDRGYGELDEALIGMALEQDKQLHKDIDFNIKIAGAAGEGVLGCGTRFAKICMASHLNVFSTAIYPSLIRGGHNHLDVRASTHKINTHRKDVDLLLALNQDGINFHLEKLTHGAGIICDDSLKIDESQLAGKDVKIFKMPLKEMGRKYGKLVFFNSVAVGAVAAITGEN
jgi:Pyruvate/2-oxoacid:ferredoxin oxidoreductase gamma subunit